MMLQLCRPGTVVKTVSGLEGVLKEHHKGRRHPYTIAFGDVCKRYHYSGRCETGLADDAISSVLSAVKHRPFRQALPECWGSLLKTIKAKNAEIASLVKENAELKRRLANL
jgi:hypothetical protein